MPISAQRRREGEQRDERAIPRRRATDEVGDLLRVDEHGVDARSLERDHVVAGGGREVGDGELPGRDVGQEVEDLLDVLLVVLGVARREEEDLRVDALERRLERIVVVDVGDDLQAERAGALVELLEIVLVVVLLDDDQAGVGPGRARGLRRRVVTEEDREVGRVTDAVDRVHDGEALGALVPGRSRAVGVADDGDDRDPVSFGDRLAERARP